MVVCSIIGILTVHKYILQYQMLLFAGSQCSISVLEYIFTYKDGCKVSIWFHIKRTLLLIATMITTGLVQHSFTALVSTLSLILFVYEPKTRFSKDNIYVLFVYL